MVTETAIEWIKMLRAIAVVVCLAASLAAQTAADVEFFEKKIRPVLAERCYACHSASATNVMGGLVVDTRDGIRKGGASGQPSISPKQPEKSLLLAAIKRTGSLKMPPGKPLSDEVIADFE